jgi:hypothetical protein
MSERYYATFGLKYRTEPHPTLPPFAANPDGVIVIDAPDYETARRLITGLTLTMDGDTPTAHYSDIYPWPQTPAEQARFDAFYSKGEQARLTFTIGA